jgi:2,3-bisphosphoglycerate-independent phosphoglycerate mutase
MINADGSPNTAHTLNLVPLFVVSNDWTGKLSPGKLGDLAPTILNIMGLEVPIEMTGNSLIS